MTTLAYIVKSYKTNTSAQKFLAGLLPDVYEFAYLNFRVIKTRDGGYHVARDAYGKESLGDGSSYITPEQMV
jgi:hypothetical protein